MIHCSFCEQPLICKACGKTLRPAQIETHLAIYQPDMTIACPECQSILVCKSCGYVYGPNEEEGED